MPKILGRVVGSKRLNKVFADYPNFYWTLHEGLAGSDPGDIPDQNGSGVVLAPATATIAQWTDKPGYWSGTSANATDYLVASRLDDPVAWDAVFDFSGVLIIMGYMFADTDPSAAGRHLSLGNQNPDFVRPIEGKYLTTGELQFVTDYGTAATQSGIDLPAEAAPNESVVIYKLDPINDTATIFCFNPATKTLQTSNEDALTSPTYPSSNPLNQVFVVGAGILSTSFTAFARNISIRDVRAINFGSNPPSDLSEIIEELAINCSLGTRR